MLLWFSQSFAQGSDTWPEEKRVDLLGNSELPEVLGIREWIYNPLKTEMFSPFFLWSINMKN